MTIKTLTIASISALFISLQTVIGATTTVIVGLGGALTFTPNNVAIANGDSVIWQWDSGGHSTTSGVGGTHSDDNGVPSGLWDSTVLESAGQTFTNKFTSPGTFSYYCTPHVGLGMIGQIVVTNSTALLHPGIGITNPLSGAVFAAPANVSIQAAVTNGSGNVTSVQFLVNSVALANATTAPFSALAANLAAGNYTLTAIALDNNNLSATNTVTISVVTPVTMVVSNLLKSSSAFQFSYPANVGLNYIVQRSTNLMTWVTLKTNTAASNPTVFTDVNATNGFNFYRVGRVPNP